ncbi:BTB/POZ/MATH-domain protein [Rhynchospora pubera]|uniref:BTB/POZ/MATH-domain protein n=1 Tax=Rhynchospora pubera TaxID=906938 RepID=A0AAV8DNU7_9POAL|nr:BTB/POZ/MATH-domain protein [Rhynchospora pubera]
MSSSVTTSVFQAEAETGSHQFKILGYSLTKGIGIRKWIYSDVFTIGGYKWAIKFYPDGDSTENKEFISFYVQLKSAATDVKAKYGFTVLQQNGVPSNIRHTSVTVFKSTSGTCFQSWGYPRFIKRSEFEASECLKDDAFTVECTITVVTKLQTTTPHTVAVPPSNLNQHLVHLLESKEGADVTFVVKGESFKAHRCVLAARSSVFRAELFGCMREKWTDTITIHDIEPPVFKSMLCFIYSDSLPGLGGINSKDGDNDSENQQLRLAQHLLVAADRYDLDRLKLLCEDLLCKNLDVSTVASTLILAEERNCKQLKAACLRFMSSPVVFKAVAQTDGFNLLLKSFPSILKDI